MSVLMDLALAALSGVGPNEQVEAFAGHARRTSVSAYGGEVETMTSAETRGVGVRVVADGRLGFASTTDVSASGLASALREARSNAALGTPDPGNVLPASADWDPLAGIHDAGLGRVPAARKVALALELERATRAADARVRAVESADYGDLSRHTAIASTTGVQAEYAHSDAYAYVSAVAGDGADTQTGFGLTTGRGFEQLDVAAAADEAAGRSVRLLGARKPPTTTVPVVFDPLVTAQFLGVLAAGLSAEAVQKGRSLFAGRQGELVADPSLHIIDDGRLTDGPAAAPVDDEGVPTRRTALVEQGVLRRFLHNSETAARAGDGALSSGNATRRGHASTPGVGPTNLFLDGPAVPVAELMARAEGALYVQDVAGLHSGVNPVSGEFSVGATGLWIRGGELTDPVREATVSSTVVEMLRAVSVLGADRRFFPFGAALAGATVLLGSMTVAGS